MVKGDFFVGVSNQKLMLVSHQKTLFENQESFLLQSLLRMLSCILRTAKTERKDNA